VAVTRQQNTSENILSLSTSIDRERESHNEENKERLVSKSM